MPSIVTVPHPVLREIARPVEKIDKKVLKVISEMQTALLSATDPEGVGLAAPQIGIPLRIFFARPNLKKPPLLFINPEIISYSQRQQIPDTKHGVYEGCLSVPHHYSPVKRSMSVTVKYQTLNTSLHTPLQNFGEGNKRGEVVEKTGTFSGFLAHIIQHEVDHLNGILFIDHVLSQDSKLFLIQGEEWTEVSL